MREYCKMELNMSNGAHVNGSGGQWFAMAVGSHVTQMSGTQLDPDTVFTIRTTYNDAREVVTNCGTYDLNGYDLYIGNIYIDAQYPELTTFEFTFDFGSAGKGVAQTLAVSRDISEYNNAQMDWSNSKIYIENFEDGSDLLLFGDLLDEKIQNRIVFLDENGMEREGTVQWKEYNGMYSYYLAAVPEPAAFAAVFGLIALVFAARRSRRRA